MKVRRTKGQNTQAREAYERSIIEHADYFTVVRYLGPRKGYERHEHKSLPAAIKDAVRLVRLNGVAYLIYAVRGVHDTFLTGIHP